MPGVPRSMTNAEMPLAPRLRSVTAITTMTCADAAVRDERLRAVQHPARRRRAWRSSAWRPRRCRRPASVSPQAPICSPLRQRHEVALLLRFGAEHEDLRGAEAVVRGDRQRHRGIDARELLDAEAVLDGGHARRRRTPPGTECPSARAPPAWAPARSENAAPRPTRARAGGSPPRRTRERCCGGGAVRRTAGSPSEPDYRTALRTASGRDAKIAGPDICVDGRANRRPDMKPGPRGRMVASPVNGNRQRSDQ